MQGFLLYFLTSVYDKRMFIQISDFGLSRDLVDDYYIVQHGGKIPLRWTAPEV